jgi:hypothetical protein
MAIQDPRNFFLNAVEARMNPADALLERTKKQLQTRYNKRAGDKANRAVDTVFYAAKDESPEDEAKRKKSEISKMLGREDSAAPKSTPLPEPEPSEEEDILRPKDRAKGTGAYLRKRESFSKLMGLEEDSAAPKSTPLPEPEPSEEEDILRPKDRAKGTGAMLKKRESFSKLMGLEEPSNVERTPKAKLVAEDEMMQSFFAKAHGGSFDPNSRVDKMKMQKILDMVNSDPKLLSLTPGKFAVKLYTTK